MSPDPQTENRQSPSGARYYHSDISIWLSVDPMAEERSWLTPYNYCQWNPIMFIDPDGNNDGWFITEGGEIKFDKDVNNQSDLEKMGIKGRYLGQEGLAIDESGKHIHFLRNGMIKLVTPLISGVTVTQEYAFDSANPSNSTNNKTGVIWDERDLDVYNKLKDDNSCIGVVIRRMVRTGYFDILSANRYWNTYGHTLGNLILFKEYYDMINCMSSYPGAKQISYRSFNLKFNSSKQNMPFLNNNGISTKPTFNEFRSANKGVFKGYKGRGTSTKIAWEIYKTLYGN